MDNFNLEVPINKVSFGNCSINILLELYKLGKAPNLMMIGGQADFGAFDSVVTKDFLEWFRACYSGAQARHSRENPTFKLWHLNGSLSSYSKEQHLFTFYELDSPTSSELNIAKNQKTVFVSSSTRLIRTRSCNGFTVMDIPPVKMRNALSKLNYVVCLFADTI
jgi:hypothetical protein